MSDRCKEELISWDLLSLRKKTHSWHGYRVAGIGGCHGAWLASILGSPSPQALNPQTSAKTWNFQLGQ